jgi:hypothetical protein
MDGSAVGGASKGCFTIVDNAADAATSLNELVWSVWQTRRSFSSPLQEYTVDDALERCTMDSSTSGSECTERAATVADSA